MFPRPALFVLAPALLASACAGPALPPPTPLAAPPPSWSAQNVADEAAVTLDWWTALGDPELDKLVEAALAHNADLRSASHRFEATLALLREARAARLPIGSIDGGLQRTRTAGASLQLDTFGGPAVLPTQTLADGGVTLGWEIDLFGRLAAMNTQALADMQQALWARRGVEAAVAAEVVRAWSDLAQSNALLAVLGKREAILSDQATRLELAVSLGGARRDRAEAAKIELAELRQMVPQVEAGQRNALRRLATLTGRPAPEGLTAFASLDPANVAAPAYVNAGRPQDLLRLRPDVAAAELELLKATAQIKVARADLYPRISMLGGFGVTAAPGDIASDGALRFGVGPAISWGLFDMDRIRARIRAAGAEAQAAGASWEAAFLKAIEETDNALDVLASTRRAALAMDQQAQAAQAMAELADQRTKAGHDSELDAMAARSRALTAQEGSIRMQGALRSAWINAQVALGAGWRDAGALKPS
jgi:NodT family efflux transporter outer membrane factor (OMF) lipoprotein